MATFSPRPTEFEFPWFDTRDTYDQSLETAITANETAAGLAQSRADSAFDNAGSAQSTADQAVDDAAAAQSTANTGVANAATAQAKADSAFSNAATADAKAVAAQSTADTALTNAATAQGDATQALADAATADGTANTALANAATADGKAVAAQGTADNAIPLHPTVMAGTDWDTLTAVGQYPVGYSSTSPNQPLSPSGGSLEVLRYAGQSRFTQRYTPAVPPTRPLTGIFLRTCEVGVWTAWSFVPAQRIDNTAGRAIYTWDETANREQLIYGDTGWRNISADLILPTGSPISFNGIRRVGQMVTLTIMVNAFEGLPNTSTIYTLPVGFRTHADARVFTMDDKGSPWRVAGPNVVQNTAVKNGTAWFTFTFPSSDPWPTTLPGTAVGTIPHN